MAKTPRRTATANPAQGHKRNTRSAKPPFVRGSKTGRPVMALLDLLGRRWTLRILWELRERSLTSRALREACDDASPTIIQTRVAELRAADLLDLNPSSGYGLTAAGQELLEMLLPLHQFAERWSKQ
ncbi:MAG: helix-turn-helix transcriptional regulator [Rhizobiales bacterium]|nr:helix-turn-helix transcriptional regulator [Hyphomicrobiales bacterium]